MSAMARPADPIHALRRHGVASMRAAASHKKRGPRAAARASICKTAPAGS